MGRLNRIAIIKIGFSIMILLISCKNNNSNPLDGASRISIQEIEKLSKLILDFENHIKDLTKQKQQYAKYTSIQGRYYLPNTTYLYTENCFDNLSMAQQGVFCDRHIVNSNKGNVKGVISGQIISVEREIIKLRKKYNDLSSQNVIEIKEVRLALSKKAYLFDTFKRIEREINILNQKLSVIENEKKKLETDIVYSKLDQSQVIDKIHYLIDNNSIEKYFPNVNDLDFTDDKLIELWQ